MDKVEGGSLVVTQNHETAAYELKHVMFRFPVATTNAFSILHIRPIKLPDTIETVVTTNEVINPATGSAWVTTNEQRYAGGNWWETNTVSVGTAATVSTRQYDLDDFGRGLTFEPYDEGQFLFTLTNTFYLIRVYDVYPRP